MTLKILSKLPKSATIYYKDLFDTAKGMYGEDKALAIATQGVLNKLRPVETGFVAHSEDFETFTTTHYEFSATETVVTHSENGKTYIDYVLADAQPVKDGTKWGAMALQSFVDTINLESVVGRIDGDHSLIKSLKLKGLTPDEIEEYLKSMNTGIKAIKATYDPKGKVVTTLEIDNAVYEEAKKYNSLSIEARKPAHYVSGEVPQGKIMSFVLTNNPMNPRANRVGISG